MEILDELKSFIKSINNKNPYEMFSIDEAAIAFNMSKLRITKAVNCKEIPEHKLDNKQRYLKRRDIEKWIDSKLKVDVPLLRANYFMPNPPVNKSKYNYETVKKTTPLIRSSQEV